MPVLVLTSQPSFITEVSRKLIHDIADVCIAAANGRRSDTFTYFSSSFTAVFNEVLV